MNAPATSPIALIGLMGAGKSEVARVLARRLGGPALDLDALIEAESGSTIAEWFERRGEPAFRMREREMLGRAIEGAAAVIACGGGTVLDEGARASLQRRCRTVWLEVSPAEAARRLRGAESVRPLLAGGTPEERLARLLEERAPLYLVASCCRIATDGRTADEVAGAVLAALAGAVQP